MNFRCIDGPSVGRTFDLPMGTLFVIVPQTYVQKDLEFSEPTEEVIKNHKYERVLYMGSEVLRYRGEVE